MVVLLTGSNGFIGQHITKILINKGIKIVAVGRSCPNNFKGLFIRSDLLQIADYMHIVKQASATHLIHLAWYTEHGDYWSSDLNLRWVSASINLIEAFCSFGGKKVVVAGTCAEYDWNYGFCKEDLTPLNPSTLYGTAKDVTRRLAESICKKYSTSFAWGRIFFPFGNEDSQSRLIPSLIEVFKGNRQPFGVNANVFRDFIHVEDVANGLIELALSNANGCYNISSGHPTQLAEVVKTIAEVFQSDPNIILNLPSNRYGDPEILFGDNKKLKMLGWSPKYDIRQLKTSIKQSYV